MTYVILEGVFYDRWAAKEIVGETAMFWELKNLQTGDVRKHKKSTTRLLRGYDTPEEAMRAAQQLTDKIAGVKKYFLDRKRDLINEFDKGVTT